MDQLAEQMAREAHLTSVLRDGPTEQATSLEDALRIARERLFRPLTVSEESQISAAYFKLQEQLHS